MSEKEILRNQRWRPGIIRHAEEVTKNVAKTCRYIGISKTAFYRWYERYQKYGIERLRDRSRRPLNSTRATNHSIIDPEPYAINSVNSSSACVATGIGSNTYISVSTSRNFGVTNFVSINTIKNTAVNSTAG